jgi:hypothetical protein
LYRKESRLTSPIRRMVTAVAVAFSVVFGLAALAGTASAGTTNVQSITLKITGDPDSGICGNTWANDNLTRKFTVTSLGSGDYSVAASDDGTWTAIPGATAPLSPTCTGAGMGSESGTITGGATFTVHSPDGAPSAALLKAALAGSSTSPGKSNQVNFTGSASYGQFVQDLFPAGAVVTGSFLTWGWTYTYAPTGEVMVQQSAAPNYTDTPSGIFTSGG